MLRGQLCALNHRRMTGVWHDDYAGFAQQRLHDFHAGYMQGSIFCAPDNQRWRLDLWQLRFQWDIALYQVSKHLVVVRAVGDGLLGEIALKRFRQVRRLHEDKVEQALKILSTFHHQRIRLAAL